MADLGMYLNAIPSGQYHVQIISSELRHLKASDGRYLLLEMKIMDGPYANQHLFDNVLLEHPDDKILDKSMRKLSELWQAADLMVLNDSEQLHYKDMIADVKVERAPGRSMLRNIVSNYQAYASVAAE